MKVAILDDYQDAVRKLNAFRVLDGLQVKIHTNNVKGLAQLSARLRDTEALVLIRGRTAVSASLLERLPNLKLVVQTGAVGPHVDVAACTRHNVLVCDGPSAPYAAAELTWALTMAAMRRLPQYVNHLKHGIWQNAGLRSHGTPDNFG
ncbi:MAG: D-2-hydroxyacid dehydrogenase family protein, partial [Proteobacteria bacterium]|nr:D-2-hydroxyacid dehydrogenase family protein [Pseudomonadota bacterium]